MYAGRWLRAPLLEQLQRRDQLSNPLKGGDAEDLKCRYSIGKRVGNILFGLITLLVGVLGIAGLIVTLLDPAALGPPHPGIGDLVLVAILLCIFALFVCGGFWQVKVAILGRLVVTSDGLISRKAGFTNVRTTTIPWSSIKSFTVMPALGASARDGYRNVVYAILDCDQPVALSGTERRLVAAAAIAEN